MAFNMTSTDSFEIELNENFNKMFETEEPNVTSNNDYINGNAISSSIKVNSTANTNSTMNSADISISTNNSSSNDSINGLNIGVGGGVGGIVNGGGLMDLGTGFDPTDGSLEGSDSLLSDDENQDCKICNNKLITPRVLSCLHVFCESCLSKLLNTNTGDINKFSDVGGVIVCPKCEQSTKVGFNGLASLHCDYIKTNILDFSRVKPDAIPCTACTVTEKAISRCNDCAHFLCSGCDKAHKCMRCFENHEVVIIDDKTEHVAMHKILYCTAHTSQCLKYYCFNCQVPICNDCLIADHKGVEHHYEVIFDAEKRIRIELIESIQNAQSKIKEYDVISNGLNNSLTDLQNQHDAAKQLIQVTCENFKKIIDKLYENTLNNLEKLHSERELKTMDCFHKVENSVNKIVNACTFTERVLKKANGPELLSLTRIIGKQFLHLNNLQKFNLNFSIEFQPKFDKFEEIAESYFGKIVTETSMNSKERTPPLSLPGMPPIINKTNGHCNNSSGTLTNSITASSPISLPTSMQSSFDGDMTLGTNYILPNLTSESSQAMNSMQIAVATSVTSGTSTSDATIIGSSTIPGLSSMAEYNLHCLANLAADSNDISNNFVSANPSPTPQFTIADLLKGDPRAFNNFQAIAKYNMNSTSINGLNGLHGMNGINDLNDNSLLTRVSSIDNVNSLLNIGDFSMPNGNQTTDDFGLSIPRSNITNGRAKPTPMQIRCKFGSLGASKGQFNAPHGFCLGVEEEIIVADTSNHRIEVFEKNGTFKFQFGVPGKEEGQLWYPRKVAVMRTNHKFVVCDRGNERSRMQLFTKNGHFIKKIAIRYIDIVAGLAVTSSGHIVAVDSVSPTVFIINEEGDLVHWFDCSDYMREPSDIAIIGSNFYICDFKGHCVAVFKENGTFLYRIGHEKITCFPNGIDISDAGDILIGDSHGNRFHVACFSRDGVLQSEFECPYVKVSRCCGLKITSEGYVVTLAKNNHHVLVLNTLYIH